MLNAAVPVAPLVIDIPPVSVGLDQLYVVPAGTIPFVPSTGTTGVIGTPLHVEAVKGVPTLIFGLGLTVTTTLKGVPAQLKGAVTKSAVGVTL